MKFIALNYNYDLKKMSDIGRKWAFDVYKNNDFICDYSAASYATFIDKNPNSVLYLYCDNIENMKLKMNQYNIDQDRVIYIDYNHKLKEYGDDLAYSFTVLNDFINYAKSDTEYTIKIDNDLIFKSELPEPDTNSILVWKYERMVKNGDVKWGEIKISKEVVNDLDFNIYNLGVFGFPPNYEYIEAKEIMDKMISVDISDVTDVGAKIYHCCEQTANNYVFHKYAYNMIETYQYVDHNFDNKGKCIIDAEYLKK
jgi:hypothetical protein